MLRKVDLNCAYVVTSQTDVRSKIGGARNVAPASYVIPPANQQSRLFLNHLLAEFLKFGEESPIFRRPVVNGGRDVVEFGDHETAFAVQTPLVRRVQRRGHRW